MAIFNLLSPMLVYGSPVTGTQWYIFLDIGSKGRKLETPQRHCAVSLSKTLYPLVVLMAIPEKIPRGGGWGGGKKANNIFFYGWLVPTFSKLYGSLVLEKI